MSETVAAGSRGTRQARLLVLFVVAFFLQNSIALPYVAKNGPTAAKDFFVGDMWKTVPGRFAMVDLLLVVAGFHTWAFADAKRLGIFRWWAVSFPLTFSVGVGAAIPFYCWVRETAAR